MNNRLTLKNLLFLIFALLATCSAVVIPCSTSETTQLSAGTTTFTLDYLNRCDSRTTLRTNTYGQAIKITINEFSLEAHSTCNYDYISFEGVDGISPTSRYCTTTPFNSTIVTPSSLNSYADFSIVFHSDGSVVRSGMDFEVEVLDLASQCNYVGYYVDGACVCIGSGCVTSEQFSMPLDDLLNDTISIAHPEGMVYFESSYQHRADFFLRFTAYRRNDEIFKFKFDTLALERNYDYIQFSGVDYISESPIYRTSDILALSRDGYFFSKRGEVPVMWFHSDGSVVQANLNMTWELTNYTDTVDVHCLNMGRHVYNTSCACDFDSVITFSSDCTGAENVVFLSSFSEHESVHADNLFVFKNPNYGLNNMSAVIDLCASHIIKSITVEQGGDTSFDISYRHDIYATPVDITTFDTAMDVEESTCISFIFESTSILSDFNVTITTHNHNSTVIGWCPVGCGHNQQCTSSGCECMEDFSGADCTIFSQGQYHALLSDEYIQRSYNILDELDFNLEFTTLGVVRGYATIELTGMHGTIIVIRNGQTETTYPAVNIFDSTQIFSFHVQAMDTVTIQIPNPVGVIVSFDYTRSLCDCVNCDQRTCSCYADWIGEECNVFMPNSGSERIVDTAFIEYNYEEMPDNLDYTLDFSPMISYGEYYIVLFENAAIEDSSTCDYDYIQLNNIKLCGSTVPSAVRFDMSSLNTMRVHSDSSVHSSVRIRGFSAVNIPSTITCQSEETAFYNPFTDTEECAINVRQIRRGSDYDDYNYDNYESEWFSSMVRVIVVLLIVTGCCCGCCAPCRKKTKKTNEQRPTAAPIKPMNVNKQVPIVVSGQPAPAHAPNVQPGVPTAQPPIVVSGYPQQPQYPSSLPIASAPSMSFAPSMLGMSAVPLVSYPMAGSMSMPPMPMQPMSMQPMQQHMPSYNPTMGYNAPQPMQNYQPPKHY
ncbi:hypothetical protein PCE1_001337 [Barthelona sp. PCE]